MAGDLVSSTKSLHIPPQHGELPEGWHWMRLADVCEGVFDCPHSTPSLTNEGPYVVRTQDIITGRLRCDQAAHVSEATYRERTSRVAPHFGDLLYSREGTYFGIAAEVPRGVRVCLGQRMVLMRPDRLRINHSFVRYWLNSPTMAAHILGYRDGTVAERLNLSTIRALPVLVPPLPEQKRIAHILGALDDKIDLNRRMNATLEGISRAIFKSWFVDFDPVRQKAAGNQPVGMDAKTAALFPDSFEDSEIGEVPKGWRVQQLGTVIELAYGKALKEEDRRRGDVPVFGSNGQVGLHDQSLVRGPGIVVGRKGNPGAVVWAASDFFPIDTTFYVVPKDSAPNLFFLFYALRGQNLASLSADSAVPGLNRNLAYMSNQLVPPISIADAFEVTARKVFATVEANRRQSSRLAALRDTLLPKLLSGAIRVPEAEEAVEEAIG